MDKISDEHVADKITIRDIKIGSLVIINEFPCQIKSITFASPGKHGSAKGMMVGYDILTDKRHEFFTQTSNTVLVPKTKKHTWLVLNIDKGMGTVTALNEKSEEVIISLSQDTDGLDTKSNLNVNEFDKKIKDQLLDLYSKPQNEGRILMTVLECFGKFRILKLDIDEK